MRINFRNYENNRALPLDRFADNFLRTAVAVHLRSVNQTHAELDSQTQRFDFNRSVALVFAHAPGSLAERWNMHAIGQADRSHVNESNLAPGAQEKTPDMDLGPLHGTESSGLLEPAYRVENKPELVRDHAESFNQRIAFCAIVNYECVVFSMG